MARPSCIEGLNLSANQISIQDDQETHIKGGLRIYIYALPCNG